MNRHVALKDLTLADQTRSPRVEALRAAYFRAVPEICTERPRLVTRFSLDKGYFDKPVLSTLDKARLYRHVLENRKPIVHHDHGVDRAMTAFPVQARSLFAGSTTSHFKGVPIFPEFMGLALWPELLSIKQRVANPYFLADEDVRVLSQEVFPDFAGELLRRLRAAGIATAIETCGEFSSPAFAQWILPHVDLILFDLKLADSEAHQEVTGRGNERIWSNLKNLLAVCPERVQVRIPLIPGITDDRKNLTALAERVAQLGGRHLTLLPYNPLGAFMAKSLGRSYPQNLPQSFQDAEQLRQTITWFTAEVARHFCATPTA